MAGLTGGWEAALREEFAKPYYRDLYRNVVDAYKNSTVYPPASQIYTAFHLTPLENVKAVILGQDPYHEPGQAHGLCFSVNPGIEIPPSLVNIYKELHDDVGCTVPDHGCLTKWAKQGVLLLNTALTFEGKETKLLREHTKLWEPVIKNIYSILCKRGNLIVMRWGTHAQKSGEVFEGIKGITVLDTTHPSPLSAHRGFMNSDHFVKCNEILGKNAIDWST